ncbi:hypothetical protein IMG5_014660 [Ichthyophthirius multifiliis]|uniref:Uncharacterized protein n=1 Tax=Ichthyophthirius multifiliis TaxID=5932 RepID=G0QK93_ICHMU|nr:hypothetical protein IMG5_014660 [Ichthyophthirius multifiliis]EGR34369.1 hypothetical protein IMG5_014660 [Ichthyophthirius multifiliis]|eukprot:XP_004039673.1 hypothetical protein IMG5_014660 [Ichthyophthirius multifiliis]
MHNTVKRYAKCKDSIPKENRKKYKNTLRDIYKQFISMEEIQGKIQIFSDQYFGVNSNGDVKINEKFISYCLGLDQFQKIGKVESNKEFKNQHGKFVVDLLKTDDDIKDFIRMWRQYFLDIMKPQFMPPAWNINHKFCREFGKGSVFYQNEQTI